MNDQILPAPFQDPAQPAQTVDHAQFRRPTAGKTPAEPSRPEQAPTPSRVPGGSAPLLSVLPTAFSVEEPEKAAMSLEPGAEEPTDAPDQTEESPAPAQKKRLLPQVRWTLPRILGVAAGLILAIILLDQILMPYLRYQKALRREEEGDYQQAVAIYKSMDGYRDSAMRAEALELDEIRAMMNRGEYQQALDALERRPSTSPLIADCLYALGVLAYNDGDAEKGLEYVDQLRERFPKYDKKTLEQYCCFTLGNQYASKAMADGTRNGARESYEEAIRYYTRAASYADSKDRIMACQYWLATIYADEWRLEEAIDLLYGLRNFRDSDQLRMGLMYDYVLSHLDSTDDQTLRDYLRELVSAGYSDAAQLQSLINGSAYTLELTAGTDNAPLQGEVTDLSEVSIRYEMRAKDGEAALQIHVTCTLPDGSIYTAYLNDDGSSAGLIGLEQLFPLSCSKSGTVQLQFSVPSYGMMLCTLYFEYAAPSGTGG